MVPHISFKGEDDEPVFRHGPADTKTHVDHLLSGICVKPIVVSSPIVTCKLIVAKLLGRVRSLEWKHIIPVCKSTESVGKVLWFLDEVRHQ